jgi:hypothetical protein
LDGENHRRKFPKSQKWNGLASNHAKVVKKRQPGPDAKGDPGPVALPMGGENKNGLDDRPHPGLLPREKEKRAPRLGNVVRRDWPDELPADRKLATVCPLLGGGNR